MNIPSPMGRAGGFPQSAPTRVALLRRLLRLAILLAPAWPSLANAADITSTWKGGNSDWTDPAKWSNSPANSQYPNNLDSGPSYNVNISTTSRVTASTNLTVNSLTLNALNATLDLAAGSFSSTSPIKLLAGTLHLGYGTLSNTTLTGSANVVSTAGKLADVTLENVTIKLDNSAKYPWLTFAGTLAGNGSIILNSNSGTASLLPSSTDTPILESSILVRTGNVNGQVGLLSNDWINRATLSAQTPGTTLFVTGSDWINEGVLEAKNGAILDLSGSINNAGRTQTVSTAGGLLYLRATINGGKLAGPWDIAHSTATLANVALDDATLTLNAGPYNSYLRITGGLAGKGQILLNGSTGANVLSTAGSTFTIGPDITIRTVSNAAATIGDPAKSFVNQGTISAAVPGNVLIRGQDWINEGKLHAANGAILRLEGDWTNTGVIDINSAMTVLTTPSNRDAIAAMVLAQLKSAYNAGWAEQGITSSLAHDDPRHITALGYRNSAGAIDVKYTYYGDANLDGLVNADDYFRIDSNYTVGAAGWSAGDFNYDGVINADDYFLIDQAFIAQGSPLSGSPFPRLSVSSSSPIPEPASLPILLLTAVLFPRCRFTWPRGRDPGTGPRIA